MATNYSNNSYDLVTDKRTIPFNSNKSGTISTKGKGVIGVGTSFLSEMPAGSVLVDESQDEWRRVVRVESDTIAYLEEAFTSDIAALTTPSVIDKKLLSVKFIKLTTATNVTINTVAFTGTIEFNKLGQEDTIQRSFIDPIILAAGGNNVFVQQIY